MQIFSTHFNIFSVELLKEIYPIFHTEFNTQPIFSKHLKIQLA